MSLEESFSRLEAEIDALIAKMRSDDGFQKGLTQGVLFALLMLRDRATQPEAPARAEERPRRAAKGSKPQSPPKDQLDLFKP